MSLRNKKLTALHTINHSLENSIERAKRTKEYHSEQKPENPLLAKIGLNPPLKKFQVRRVTQNETEAIQTKTRFRSIRMQTEKLVRSPNSKKHVSPYERTRTIEVREGQQQQKIPLLTSFERQQANRYELFYIGTRRIHSIKDFTNSSCEARVTVGDSIAYRYEIVSGLGHGSFGQVFKSFDHKKKEMVALKIIRNEPKFNRQAKIQIKILETAIMHDSRFRSNIVQLKHAFFFRGHACLVFQLLHINLYEYLKLYKFNGMSLDLIRRIAIQILQGLNFFKRHKIIHCDLKPENVLFKQENKTGIKIIDAGSGCFEGEQLYTYIQSRYYRAPEVILGIMYTSAIDIWSFGCILCELFLGYPIFPGENEPEQMLMFMEVLGIPPVSLIERGTRSSKFFQGSLPRVKANSKGKIRRPGSKSLESVLTPCSDIDFIHFVKRLLGWVPEDRLTAQEALVDGWILKGLPEQIRKQHIATSKKDSYF